MVGFFRNLAQAAKEGYNAAKQELAAQQAQQNGHNQNQVHQQQQLQQNHSTSAEPKGFHRKAEQESKMSETKGKGEERRTWWFFDAK